MNNLILESLEVNRVDVALENRPLAATAIASGDHTITIADIQNGILRSDPAAARDFTLPTAALAVAGTPGCNVGDCIDFHIINLGTAGENETITVVTASGATLIGFMDVENSATTHDAFSVGSGMFRLQFTNVTASSEAYDLIRLA
tara:strand:+ start:888 stop:1325 length:438 start_codon:yes stop_codon:yes gene_type:complete